MRRDPPRRLRAADLGREVVAALPRYGLVAWAMAAVVCALLPLSTALIDVLLSLSLAVSVGLMVCSLVARRSSDLLVFPVVLILVTFSRLALNVATTRMILGQADAGRVIDAFATLVIGGDLLVGAVMFAIVTMVQLVVVSRGAERIAEVGARFALDALPGHQAAIEADLKAAAISAGEAARRRGQLLERSNFHGAMDGAARFIKGDALMGLVLTAINLCGGVAVGTVQRGLGPGEALALYGRLTIGDGLLAQIPALLVGLSAAVLVARVDREEPGARRGEPLSPGVLAAPAGLLAVLALAPGMPAAVFGATAASLLAAAIGLRRARGGAPAPAGRRICVCLAGHGPEDIAALRRPLVELRRRCSAALGIEVPEIVAVGAEGAAAPAIEVRLDERVFPVQEDISGGVDAVVVAVFRAVMRGAEALIDLQAIEEALEVARTRRPAAVREATRALGPADLLELVRGLLRERVPLPGFEVLLEAVAAEPICRQAGERGRWTAAVRERLAGCWVRDVVAAHARLGPLRWARPRPDAEAALLERVVAGEAGVRLNLSAAARRSWWTRVLAGREEGEPPPLLVCTPRARPAFALLLARGSPHVTVLSTGELQAADLAVPGEVGGPAAGWFDAPVEPARGLTLAGVAGEIAAS